MNKKQKQQALLAVLALVLLVVMGRQISQKLTGGPGAGSPRRTSSTRGADLGAADWKNTLPLVEELRLEDLELRTEALDEGRDPFQLSRQEPPPIRQPQVSSSTNS